MVCDIRTLEGRIMYKKAFVNQCGYQTDMRKLVTFQSEEPVEYCVLRSDGSCVFEGRADKKVLNESAKETNFVGDFSEVREVSDGTLWEAQTAL